MVLSSALVPQVGIVGGGLAGIAAAKTLAAAGIHCVIYEKERLLGGRLGVLKIDDQYIGAACCYMKGSKDASFMSQLYEWEADGLVEEWNCGLPFTFGGEPGIFKAAPQLKPPGEKWFVTSSSKPFGISAFSEKEREFVTVRTSTTVVGTIFDELENCDGDYGWRVESRPADLYARGEDIPSGLEMKYACRHPLIPVEHYADQDDEPFLTSAHRELVLAMPVDPAQALAGGTGIPTLHGTGGASLRNALRSPQARTYLDQDFTKRRFSAIITFSTSLGLPFEFALDDKGHVITVMMKRSRLDGLRSKEETWVFQTDTKWAAKHDTDPTVLSLLKEELQRILGRPELPLIIAEEFQSWSYGDRSYKIGSDVDENADVVVNDGPCAWIPEQQIAFAGDWAVNGRAEGAWMSGRAAAACVVQARSKGQVARVRAPC